MNNEDHVIFARERVEMEGAVAGGVSGEEHGSFKAGSSRFIAPMWTGGCTFRQGYITHAA